MYAQSDTASSFNISAVLSYHVLDTLQTRVEQTIVITNKKEFVYSPAYSITLHIKNIRDISVQGSKGDIPYTVADAGGDTKTIDITFPQRILGVGAQNTFTFSYTSSDFVSKTGDITRVTIPSVATPSDFTSYSATVIVPSSFGKPSLAKPGNSYRENANAYTFTKDSLQGEAIELYFGQLQLYKFNLTYNLENKNLFPTRTEIALPPNTTYQNALLGHISPKPDSTYVDVDGNVLATYLLPAKSTRTVTAETLVSVSDIPSPENLSADQKALFLKPQKYWEVDNPEIKKIAENLRTPEAIYDYTVKTLEYNKGKTADQNTRLGALGALAKPNFAVCLEFTDLFVALARSAGIPARAIEGYAYTGDESDKPLSLFQDVLHAWPEYYDAAQKTWVMVDPTWGNTTGGVDYFHSLDFDHVAFAVNGRDSAYPIPAGGYKIDPNSKDITVSFPSYVEFVKNTDLGVSGNFSSFAHGKEITGTLTLVNNGNYEIPGYSAYVLLDGKNAQFVTFPATPPLGTNKIAVSIPIPAQNFLASLTNITHTVTIQSGQGKVLSSNTVRVFPFSEFLLIGGAAFGTAVIIFIIAFKTRSLPVQRR
ncbi:MAG: transglutaminase family protein [Candidatus Levyibacteriota bacterium]